MRSGTLKSSCFPSLRRSPGILHTVVSKSISVGLAKKYSYTRVAVDNETRGNVRRGKERQPSMSV